MLLLAQLLLSELFLMLELLLLLPLLLLLLEWRWRRNIGYCWSYY
jgi:hypothetical protein